MPPKLNPITAETVAARIELHPDTITLAGAKAIYNRLGDTAATDGHHELKVDAYDMAKAVQELIEAPGPSNLVASARLINEADNLLVAAGSLRDLTAECYDRFRATTKQATEALEILTAWTVMLEAADFELRTGTRAA